MNYLELTLELKINEFIKFNDKNEDNEFYEIRKE